MESLPRKASILGTPISVTTYEGVCEALERRRHDVALVVACCNVHSVMTARRDPAVRAALASADIATPDGMPLVWALRALHEERLPDRVYGPDLMLHALHHGVARQWKHFFYGTTPETLDKLTSEVTRRIPGVLVVGSESPPFREITDRELEEAAARIRAADTDILWLGLGMPKQELLMRRFRERLPGVALLGVGAAFDFVAGNVPQAPRWLQNLGGEWAFRLAQEPRRLWRRYAWNNPAYLGLLGYEWMRKAKRRPLRKSP